MLINRVAVLRAIVNASRAFKRIKELEKQLELMQQDITRLTITLNAVQKKLRENRIGEPLDSGRYEQTKYWR